MMLATAFVWLALSPSPQEPTAGRVVVELRSGESLTGHLRARSAALVELEIEAGAVVGLAAHQVRSIHAVAHAAATTTAVPAGAGPCPPPAPRSEWFLLHDATGLAVGWLRSGVLQRADGSLDLSEEYEFVTGAFRYQVTLQSRATAALVPLECYFRERISEPSPAFALPAGTVGGGERLRQERIVRAMVVGDELLVQRLDERGRAERRLARPAAATLPLLAAYAQQQGRLLGVAPVFDPAGEQFVRHEFRAGRTRTVLQTGTPQPVTEWVTALAEASAAAATAPLGDARWCNAAGYTVHRELAGPGLVAAPSGADSVPFAVGAAQTGAALVVAGNQQLGLWRPNPAWRTGAVSAAAVQLECPVHGATAQLQELGAAVLPRELPPETAVLAWWQLLHAGAPLGERQRWQWRGQPATRWFGSDPGAGGRRYQVDLLPAAGRWLLLVQEAPALAFDELAEDFAFVAAHVEGHPAALQPKAQGPLADGPLPPLRGRWPSAAAAPR
ncbi:MAG: hypothetical protein JNK49_07080 [Planctomycetes bacterium]|nr:hypothetical protein [Planctomycetota bacterium]